jgi:hypothetical protein
MSSSQALPAEHADVTAAINRIFAERPDLCWETLVTSLLSGEEFEFDLVEYVRWITTPRSSPMRTVPGELLPGYDMRTDVYHSVVTISSTAGKIDARFRTTEEGMKNWTALMNAVVDQMFNTHHLAAALAITSANNRPLRLSTFDAHFDGVAAMFNVRDFGSLIAEMESRARDQGADTGKYVLVTTPDVSKNLVGVANPATISRMECFGHFLYTFPSFTMIEGHTFHPFEKRYEVGLFAKFSDDEAERDIMVKTASGDWTRLSFEYALEHLSCFDKDGKVIVPSELGDALGKPAWWQQTVEDYAYYPLKGDGKTPSIPDRDEVLRMHKDGEHVPFGILALWPSIRGYGYGAYYVLPGKSLRKATKAIGENFAITPDVTGDFYQLTCDYTAVCFCRNKDVVEIPTVAVASRITAGYGSVKVIAPNIFHDPNFSAITGGGVIFVAVPLSFTDDRVPRNLNLRGIVEKGLKSAFVAPPVENLHENSYPGYRYCDALFRWTERGCGEFYRREYNVSLWVIDFPVNIGCRRGTYRKYDPATKDFETSVHAGTEY